MSLQFLFCYYITTNKPSSLWTQQATKRHVQREWNKSKKQSIITSSICLSVSKKCQLAFKFYSFNLNLVMIKDKYFYNCLKGEIEKNLLEKFWAAKCQNSIWFKQFLLLYWQTWIIQLLANPVEYLHNECKYRTE